MSQQKSHDLYDFMRQIGIEMSAEYNRIQMRATEDPGTAGDRGRRIGRLLREWLPRTYEVVTKGRIISQEGVTSPQIDVIVLKGAYPKKLLNKKLYLTASIAAAFGVQNDAEGIAHFGGGRELRQDQEPVPESNWNTIQGATLTSCLWVACALSFVEGGKFDTRAEH